MLSINLNVLMSGYPIKHSVLCFIYSVKSIKMTTCGPWKNRLNGVNCKQNKWVFTICTFSLAVDSTTITCKAIFQFTYSSPFSPLPNDYSVQDIDPWVCSKYKLIKLNKSQSVFPSEWCHPGKNSWVVIFIISLGNKFADTWTEHTCKIIIIKCERTTFCFISFGRCLRQNCTRKWN